MKYVIALAILVLAGLSSPGWTADGDTSAVSLTRIARAIAELDARLTRVEKALAAKQDAEREALDRDRQSLQSLARMLAQEPELPLHRGALDPYALALRGGEPSEHWLRLLYGARAKQGPGAVEVLSRDYTKFPYERLANGAPTVHRSVPLLWDKKPSADGTHLVVTGAGHVEAWSVKQLASALQAAGHQAAAKKKAAPKESGKKARPPER